MKIRITKRIKSKSMSKITIYFAALPLSQKGQGHALQPRIAPDTRHDRNRIFRTLSARAAKPKQPSVKLESSHQ
jgi:hypothetical protein